MCNRGFVESLGWPGARGEPGNYKDEMKLVADPAETGMCGLKH